MIFQNHQTKSKISFQKGFFRGQNNEGSTVRYFKGNEQYMFELKNSKDFFLNENISQNIKIIQSSFNENSKEDKDLKFAAKKFIKSSSYLDVNNKFGNEDLNCFKMKDSKSLQNLDFSEKNTDLKLNHIDSFLDKKLVKFENQDKKKNFISDISSITSFKKESGLILNMKAFNLDSQNNKSLISHDDLKVHNNLQINSEAYRTLQNKNYNNDLFTKTIANSGNHFIAGVDKNEGNIIISDICFICQQIKFKTKIFFSECGHKYCFECVHYYFEDRIELGDFSLKCPKYTCKININQEFVMSQISDKHKEKFHDKFNKSQNDEKKTNEIKSSLNQLTMVKKKNVIEICYNEDIIMNYSKLSKNICIKCFELTLFGKFNNNFVKCLNCEVQLCKFCLKEWKIDHLRMTNSQYCRIYSRRSLIYEQNIDKKYNLKFLIFSFIVIILSYFFMFVVICFKFNESLSELCLKSGQPIIRYLIKLLIRLLTLIFIILSIILAWFCYPFFPLLLVITR